MKASSPISSMINLSPGCQHTTATIDKGSMLPSAQEENFSTLSRGKFVKCRWFRAVFKPIKKKPEISYFHQHRGARHDRTCQNYSSHESKEMLHKQGTKCH
jgi:hypothetical protein